MWRNKAFSYTYMCMNKAHKTPKICLSLKWSLQLRKIVGVCFALILIGMAFAQSPEPPVSFHLSFDNEDYLAHDYSALMAKFEDLTPEKRNLKLVPGRFGQALLNANVFVQEDFEKTHMSVRDLDTLLEVICHYRYPYWKDGLRIWGMEPYIWGTGKIKTDGGTLAFWAKGARTYPGDLFFLSSSSFGRLEQYLLAIELKEDGRLEAYIRDARYVYHRITTKPGLWDETRMNHIALVWDRSQGLQLYLNGEVVSSNWGKDAWWTTQTPGLFHMPMCGFLYDELWVLDRPASNAEVQSLITSNVPTKGLDTVLDSGAIDRLKKAFIGSAENLTLMIRRLRNSMKSTRSGRATGLCMRPISWTARISSRGLTTICPSPTSSATRISTPRNWTSCWMQQSR